MQIIHQHGGTYTLNFARGEEVMAGIADFCKEKGIAAAHITGLGAASKLLIAYYNLETKEYEKKEFTEDVEILSLTGNVGVKEGLPASDVAQAGGSIVVHIHGTFGRRDFSVFGGHIFEMVISGAGEVHLTALGGTISRAYDEATGLTLMCPLT